MKRIAVIVTVLVALSLLAIPVMGAGYPAGKGKGFDTYGYNYQARLFNGLLGNADRDSDPNTYGGLSDDTTTIDGVDYVIPVPGTHLVMKWSKAWDNARFHGATWATDAWVTNHYTWTDSQGTHTAYYRIEWTGPGGELWGSFTITRAIFDGQKIR